MQFKLWENENGTNYAGDFLEEQGDFVVRKLLSLIQGLEGVPLQTLLKVQKVKKIDEELYEIRLRFRSIDYRFLFVQKEDRGVIVEAFIKKTNKIPLRHIETAKQRTKNITASIP